MDKTSLFDHLVGASEQHRGNFDPNRFRRIGIDHQLKFRGLLDGQIGRFGALEYLVNIFRAAKAASTAEAAIWCAAARSAARCMLWACYLRPNVHFASDFAEKRVNKRTLKRGKASCK